MKFRHNYIIIYTRNLIFLYFSVKSKSKVYEVFFNHHRQLKGIFSKELHCFPKFYSSEIVASCFRIIKGKQFPGGNLNIVKYTVKFSGANYRLIWVILLFQHFFKRSWHASSLFLQPNFPPFLLKHRSKRKEEPLFVVIRGWLLLIKNPQSLLQINKLDPFKTWKITDEIKKLRGGCNKFI